MTMHFDSVITAKIPMPLLDIQRKEHDKIVILVKNIIELNNKLTNEKNPNYINLIQRQIYNIDDMIDKLIYSIYKLSSNEIRITENN